jgi:hypothetical protein
VTARSPNATDLSVTDSEILTTNSYPSRWPDGAGAAARERRDDGVRARAYQIRGRRAGFFRITELWMFAQLRGLLNGQKTLIYGR